MDSLKDNIRNAKVILQHEAQSKEHDAIYNVLCACEKAISAIDWILVTEELPIIPPGREWVPILYEDETGNVQEGKYSNGYFSGWSKLIPRPVRWARKVH